LGRARAGWMNFLSALAGRGSFNKLRKDSAGRREVRCYTRSLPRTEPRMLTVSKDHPLLTTITGSLPRPHWFVQNLQGRPFSLAMTDVAFREQYTDAVAAYLSDQTRAGLDLLTDGDARCDCDVGGRSWFAYP